MSDRHSHEASAAWKAAIEAAEASVRAIQETSKDFWEEIDVTPLNVRIDCWCITCDGIVADAQLDNGDTGGWFRTFIACPDCGNKRCPRATHHDNACTGSNETGQSGSAYS